MAVPLPLLLLPLRLPLLPPPLLLLLLLFRSILWRKLWQIRSLWLLGLRSSQLLLFLLLLLLL